MALNAKVLVVDDELAVCKSIRNALADVGYSVDMALSGEEALRKEKECEYDVVITDLMMPGLSGMDLLKNLEEKRPDIKVIIITGYPSIKTAVQSIKLGAFDYIPKPFTPNELRSLVSRALESKRYHEEKAAEGTRPGEGREEEISMPPEMYFMPENSWVMIEQNGNARIGIHHVFLRTIEKITSIESPKENDLRYQGEVCLRVTDSHMHVHKVWAPVSGRVIAVNEEIKKDYSKLMQDPYKEGWVLLISPLHLEEDLRNLRFSKSTDRK